MRKGGALLIVLVSSTAVGQPLSGGKGSVRRLKFSAGETVVESVNDTDHVIVKDAQGKKAAESWCAAGTFDLYAELFGKLSESVSREDRSAVVKLAAFPLRVNAKKALTFRSEASLLNEY